MVFKISAFLKRAAFILAALAILHGIFSYTIGYPNIMFASIMVAVMLIVGVIITGGAPWLLTRSVVTIIETFLFITGFGSYFYFHSPTGNYIAMSLLVPGPVYLLLYLIMREKTN